MRAASYNVRAASYNVRAASYNVCASVFFSLFKTTRADGKGTSLGSRERKCQLQPAS